MPAAPVRPEPIRDAQLDRIAPLWGQASAQQIAKALGTTKNAVIGLVYRARLRGDTRFPADRDRAEAWERKMAPKRQAEAEAARVAAEMEASRPAVADAVMALGARQCRWIDGEVPSGRIAFCPQTQVAGSSYCGKHARKAIDRSVRKPFVPPEKSGRLALNARTLG